MHSANSGSASLLLAAGECEGLVAVANEARTVAVRWSCRLGGVGVAEWRRSGRAGAVARVAGTDLAT